MSTSTTETELSLLTRLTWSKQAATPEELAALRAVVERAVADDGPTVDELPARWLGLAAQTDRDRYTSGSASDGSMLGGMANAMRGCATDLAKALKRKGLPRGVLGSGP